MDPFTVQVVGGQRGSPFAFDGKDNAATVQQLSVTVGDSQVKGVKVSLTDGRREKFGISGRTAQTFEFAPGEFMTRLSLWDNGDGTRLGAIRFWTSHGREFFAKMKDRDLRDENEIDVGSGICLGVQGRSGSEIDCMGFLFLDAVESSVIRDVKYPTLHRAVPDVRTETLESKEYTDGSSGREESSEATAFAFECSKSTTERSSWSTAHKIDSTFNLSVEAGIPVVTCRETGFGLTVDNESTYQVESSAERTETLAFQVVVPPRKTVSVVLSIGRADISLPYTALLYVTCRNGALYTVPLVGVYNGVTYSKLKATVTQM